MDRIAIVPRRHLVNRLVSQSEIAKNIYKTHYFGVQGHLRLFNSAPIERQCVTSY